MSIERSSRLHDISIQLNPGTPPWPGDTPYTCGWTARIGAGSSVNVSKTTSSPHAGTHADAPVHVTDGAPGSHELPLQAFIGDALVIDASAATEMISASAIRALGATDGVHRLLVKTGRSIAAGSFPESWPRLSDECAEELVARGLQLLGVDAPSVDARTSKSLPVHKILFAAGACVVENLDLRSIAPGRYELIALPIKVEGLDAAPVRAVLRDAGV